MILRMLVLPVKGRIYGHFMMIAMEHPEDPEKHRKRKEQWVDFGSGLDAADFSRYNGQLRDGNQKVAASVYATMAMHAGHIGTQVIMKGRLIFNATTQLFQAVDDQYSLANIVRLKAEIIKMLGEQRAANLVSLRT